MRSHKRYGFVSLRRPRRRSIYFINIIRKLRKLRAIHAFSSLSIHLRICSGLLLVILFMLKLTTDNYLSIHFYAL